jgi:hypothetical protein
MKRLTTIFLMLCFFSAGATSWRLNNNPAVDADFTTFQAAHDAASAGDTIYFEGTGDQTHYGTITIIKKLVIIGPGYFLMENDSTYANPVYARVLNMIIEPQAAGTEVYGLFFRANDGSGHYHIQIKASNVIIARNYFHSLSYDRIKLSANIDNVTINQNYIQSLIETLTNSVVANNIIISNNYIEDRISLNNLSNGILTNNVIRHGFVNVYNSQIKNNIIFATGLYEAFCVNNTGNYIAYNLVSNNLVSGGNYGPGNIGNVDMSTVFVGYPAQGSYSTDGRWQLKAGSPAIGAGEGGIDCGMFGGSLPYVLSGLPAIPRIYEAIVPTAGSTTSGLPVIIKAKSQN